MRPLCSWPWLLLLPGCLLAHESVPREVDGSPDDVDAGASPPREPTVVLDPDEVYLLVRPRSPACTHAVVSHWRTPTQTLAELPCDASRGMIRPADGRLVYSTDVQPRVFQQSTGDDEPLATPRCEPDDLIRVLMKPDVGYAYHCADSGWYDERAELVLPYPYDLYAIGVGDALLLPYALRLPIQGEVAIVGLRLTEESYSIRVRDDGFWLVRGELYAGAFSRWHVGFDGVAKHEVTYGAPPTQDHEGHVLDRNGDLYLVMTRLEDGHVTLERRTQAGAIEIRPFDDSVDGYDYDFRLITGP